MKNKQSSFTWYMFVYLIPFIMILSLMRMYGFDTHNYLDYIFTLILGVKGVQILFQTYKNRFANLVTIFLVYSFLTGFAYLYNEVPFKCYYYSFLTFWFSALFFYFGYRYCDNEAFDRMFMYGCCFCFVLGFYYHFTADPVYINFVVERNAKAAVMGYNESNILDFARFGSFFGNSYYIEFFSIPTLILSLFYLNTGKFNNIILYFIAFTSFVAALLSIQRIAVGFAFLVLIVYFLSLGRIQSLTKWVFIILFAALFANIGYNYIESNASLDSVSSQFSNMADNFSFSGALDERKNQYESFDRATGVFYIFGLGMGSCGHYVIPFGFKSINDNEYMHLFYEFGIVGISLLFAIFFRTLLRGIHYIKFFLPETLIVVYYLAASLGSDPTDITYCSFMLWFVVGRIWNKDRELMINNHFSKI